jgi:uncharacterized membrane protein HdeD (DUF308 family)
MKKVFGIVTLLVGIFFLIACFTSCDNNEEIAGFICGVIGIIVGYTGFKVLKS